MAPAALLGQSVSFIFRHGFFTLNAWCQDELFLIPFFANMYSPLKKEFFNCAEVSILPSGPSHPTISPEPTQNPTVAQPTISESPTDSPMIDGPPLCLTEWQDCTYDWRNCCEGYKCRQVDPAGYGRCLEDSCSNGEGVDSIKLE